METILIIDDDPGFRRLLETILAGEGFRVESGGSVADALRLGSERLFDLVLTDLRLPDGDGTSVVCWFHEHARGVPVVVVTAFGTVASAVAAMKLGAADYLGKPLASPDELRILVRRLLEARRVRDERDLLREQQESRFGCAELIAQDPGMRQVLELAAKVAPTPSTVLITGESGTGKELVARCIHRNSARAGRAFVGVNCAALAPALIESELFGHEKGAFTGAAAQHAGRFERAQGGTLFLDEIAELDPGLQVKLLRVLQERTFERVGGTRQIAVDVRIIAATNREMKQLLEAGKFREDLYYRLSAFPLHIPALRQRPADIPLLAEALLKRAVARLGKPNPALTQDALEALLAYDWPGNVRELENVMERMAILCEDRVTARDLPVSAGGAGRPLRWIEIERQAIEQALHMNNGNRTLAARQLGISLRTLQYRLKGYRD